jgi:hypothetical protein
MGFRIIYIRIHQYIQCIEYIFNIYYKIFWYLVFWYNFGILYIYYIYIIYIISDKLTYMIIKK